MCIYYSSIVRVRLKIICNARIKNIGQYESSMVYQLRIILKRARILMIDDLQERLAEQVD